ncbi:MAG: Nucleoid occlusion factor SlmA [Fimbriimonadaceae bacterium]|nr:Nucleoid occlusion factor SlmA [Fimbriimonadaceae bacterium]
MQGRKRLAGEDRKKQIAAAALNVFARKGFDGATTRELAEAAGVSEALIYRHFPDKEGLYNELITLLGAQDKNQLTSRWTSSEPGTSSLVSVLYSLSRVILLGPPGRPKDDSIDRLVGQSLLGDGTFASAFLQEYLSPLVPYLCDCMEKAWESGDIDAQHAPGELEAFLFHHFVGAVALFRLPDKPLLPISNPHQLHRAVLFFVCRGLGLTETALDRTLDFEQFARSFKKSFNPEKTP